MIQPLNPAMQATDLPPVMEARRWLDGVVFPPNRPLINVSQAAPEPTVFGGREQSQVSDFGQFGQVLVEERVLAIVPGGTTAHSGQQFVGEHGFGHHTRLRPRPVQQYSECCAGSEQDSGPEHCPGSASSQTEPNPATG